MRDETGPMPREQRFNEVVASYVQAIERGQAPGRDELVARHPDLAADLSAFFHDHDRLNQLAAGLRAAVQGGSMLSDLTVGFRPTNPGRVLESIGESIGSIPRVFLPDTQLDDAGVPLVQPSSP